MSYLKFVHNGNSPSGKTKIWDVVNYMFGIVLGVVKWHAPWRKYIFFPAKETGFDSGCLREIADSLDKSNQEHKDA